MNARVAAACAVAIGLGGAARADVSAGGDAQAASSLVEKWLAAQNAGDFAAYRALYAARFTGIRRSGSRKVELDHDGWLEDRERTIGAAAGKITARIEKKKLDSGRCSDDEARAISGDHHR